ncbi:patatin-like phospholipase family protein [Myxococcota bacterium]|nr:patatin-like phospholipase family protein [Myxococcota bacterium]
MKTNAATQTHKEWLQAEPFTLSLSAGFFGFFAHTGVLAALEDAGLKPKRVVGVSAGALVGGLYGFGLSASTIKDELFALRRQDFWDPGFPLLGLLRGKRFLQIMEDYLPQGKDTQMEDASVPVSVVAYDLLRRKTQPLCHGPAAKAIVASCSVPLMFRPVRWKTALLVDGGVADRAALTTLKQNERTLFHFLPHSISGFAQPREKLADAPAPSSQRKLFHIDELPKVSPFKMENGKDAYYMAYERTSKWLGESE